MSTYVQGGPKVMSWAMMVDGQVFIHWFDIGAHQKSEVYVQEVLEGFMWPILQTMPNRARYWFQQDGARSHTSNLSLEWLREKFGHRIISGNTDIPWIGLPEALTSLHLTTSCGVFERQRSGGSSPRPSMTLRRL